MFLIGEIVSGFYLCLHGLSLLCFAWVLGVGWVSWVLMGYGVGLYLWAFIGVITWCCFVLLFGCLMVFWLFCGLGSVLVGWVGGFVGVVYFVGLVGGLGWVGWVDGFCCWLGWLVGWFV